MLDVSGNSPRRAVRQPRRRWGSYRLSIEQRAAAAAIKIRDGWRPKQAAGLFGVCPTYVALARKLSDADRSRLAAGELKLAILHKDHLRHLAELRAQRLAAEGEAKAQAKRAAQLRAVDNVIEAVGVDQVINRIVTNFGPEPLMVALDAHTAPQRVAAE